MERHVVSALRCPRKIFTIGGKKLRVSVMETTKASGPLAKKDELPGERNNAFLFCATH